MTERAMRATFVHMSTRAASLLLLLGEPLAR